MVLYTNPITGKTFDVVNNVSTYVGSNIGTQNEVLVKKNSTPIASPTTPKVPIIASYNPRPSTTGTDNSCGFSTAYSAANPYNKAVTQNPFNTSAELQYAISGKSPAQQAGTPIDFSNTNWMKPIIANNKATSFSTQVQGFSFNPMTTTLDNKGIAKLTPLYDNTSFMGLFNPMRGSPTVPALPDQLSKTTSDKTEDYFNNVDTRNVSIFNNANTDDLLRAIKDIKFPEFPAFPSITIPNPFDGFDEIGKNIVTTSGNLMNTALILGGIYLLSKGD